MTVSMLSAAMACPSILVYSQMRDVPLPFSVLFGGTSSLQTELPEEESKIHFMQDDRIMNNN